MLSLQQNHTSCLYLDGAQGVQQPSGKAYRHTTLYHLWQPINTCLTFFNSDLEGEASGYEAVLMIQSPSNWAC